MTGRTTNSVPGARKRLLDLFLAVPALIVFGPLIMLLALAIRLTTSGPVLFRQQRPGRWTEPFVLYKFATMTDARDDGGELLPDGLRLTRLGRLLRRVSLDELPQLFNVLKGEMSFVGPRPLLMRYLPYFSERERLRFTVPPGVTGWAQVHGRNSVSWTERLAMDVWYVEHWSLGLDLRILIRTIGIVLRSRGVVVDARSEMLNLDEERAVQSPAANP